ncbi:DUF4932 domain-containing protein [Natronospora cellulosivora (SeqCode)]
MDPHVEKHFNMIEELDLYHLFEKVRREMRAEAYGTPEIFFKEQVLRGVTTVAAGELYGERYYDLEKEQHIGRNFHLTEITVELIEYYQENRDDYSNFGEFVPLIFEAYKEIQD